MERRIPLFGLKINSAKRGMFEGGTLDLRLNLLKIQDTRTFSSINANLSIALVVVIR